MAITKTDFVLYSRCPRYLSLESIKSERLDSEVSFSEYEKEERERKLEELFFSMVEEIDGEYIDKTEKLDKQLEAMLPYYKQVEVEASRIVKETFGGTVSYAMDTKEQVSFDFLRDGVRFVCYVDIYNECEENVNVVEVKATTSKKYLRLGGKNKGSERFSIFKNVGNVYKLKGEIDGYPLSNEMPLNVYEDERNKLFDRFGIGEYVYDLAIQRYILEGEYKSLGREKELAKVHYYLAVLNDQYVFDGKYENGEAVYGKDSSGNDIVVFFDMDELTKEYQPFIREMADKLVKWLKNPSGDACPLGPWCGYKSRNECKFFKSVCGAKIPLKNSSLNYINNAFGFVKEDGTRIKGLELVNEGYLGMLDVPEAWIKRNNHKIQRECLETHKEFMQKDKIKALMDTIKYPIYHLDFETFPCPLPRFRGESPYTQSPFEFSLHIESSPGICDKQKDNVVFLARTMEDEREDLVKCLLSNVDVNKGTLLAQNVSFEKGRIKELASVYPKYHDELMKLYDRGFDLIWLLNNNKELYQSLGFTGEELDTFNFYDERLSGSFSIKKTLPVFTSLSYDNLVVKNGTEAIVEYANYKNMSKEEYELKYQALKIYCQQDTWAMVQILDALRKKLK